MRRGHAVARRCTTVVALAAAWLATRSAHADAPAEPSTKPADAAAEHFEAALAHADRKNFELAITEFERAYALEPHPIVSYNLGLAHAALGQSALALAAFERSLREGGEALDAERAERIRALIKLEKAKLGRLELELSPSDASVTIDGSAAFHGGPVWLDPGLHRVTVRANGHEPFSGEVTLRANETTRLAVDLTPIPPPTPSVRIEPRAEAPAAGAPARADTPVDRGSGGDSRLWAYVSGGGGVVLGGIAILTYVEANSRYDRWKLARDLRLTQPSSDPDLGAKMAKLKSDVQMLDILSASFGIGAGALLATGTYLFLTASDAPSAEVTSVTFSGSTLLVSGRF